MSNNNYTQRTKVSIIGGGISGCIVAYQLSELGYEVSLFEKKDKLGGTIRDVRENNEVFYNGPQYFYKNSNWIKKLKKINFFKSCFQEFNGSYIKKKKVNVFKSYVDLFNTVDVNHLFAQPSTKLKFKKLKLNKESKLLKGRLNSYQGNIKKPLEDWCKGFSSHYQNLHESCAEILNVTRVFFSRDKNKVKIMKENNNLADKLLGLPMLADKEYFCVPKKGYDKFFQELEKLLRKKISIHLNSKIKIENDNNNYIKVFNHDQQIKSDKIIWAANPIPLMNELKFNKLDNPIVRTKIYCANIKFEEKYNCNNFYIQVFSKKSNIYRIYIYKLNNKLKITIETFMRAQNNVLDIKFLNNLFLKFQIKIKTLGNFVEKKEVRHILITKNDYNKFMKFEEKFRDTNLIGGGWHLFGRDNKINYIMKYFQN